MATKMREEIKELQLELMHTQEELARKAEELGRVHRGIVRITKERDNLKLAMYLTGDVIKRLTE